MPPSDIFVFVTGNAPYRENTHNTSRMIRDALPPIISRPGQPDIVVLKFRQDSLDVYKDILKMVKEVWTAKRTSFLPEPSPDHEDEVVDFAFGLHLGMTTAVPEFRAEKIAHRDGYERPGEDKVYVDKEYFQKLDLPGSLKPAFDSDAAVAQMKARFPETPIRADDKPNQGFCEYRLYSSLAELQLHHPSKLGRAAFLHVPKDQSPDAIQLGAEVTTAYITALVDQLELGTK
ncbi:hypothetical protein O1611_g9380 [Lasiodiplodia mahajangana]|uniref:Uncharacterized protein n=1 Tax=Lasiodiplodia mahajangana TaxID=1108764 RepID=A0ACC2JA75_9PEZI|nr:hypothetical protein O1611_g9380 [Lasiodiplodia mahajangana]